MAPPPSALTEEWWDSDWRNTNHFHEHVGFLALMLVCAACAIYLMGVLEPIVRPFLWALFLVTGLQPAVTCVERILLRLFSLICRCSVAAVALCVKLCPLTSAGPSDVKAHRWLWALRWWRRIPLHRTPLPKGSPPIPGMVLGSGVQDPTPTNTRDRLSSPSNDTPGFGVKPTLEDVQYDQKRERLQSSAQRGRVQRIFAHIIAVSIVVAGVVCIVSGTMVLLVQSALSLKGNWDIYEKGASQLIDSVQDVTSRWMLGIPEELAEELATDALSQAELVVSTLIKQTLSNFGRLAFEMVMMALYIAFWLADPVPVSGAMEELFRRYLLLKGTACLGYGICVTVCLQALNIDLAVCFGFLSFCLSFVPEVGAIVAVVLPAPVILLDSRLHSPALTLMTATAMQLGLKFLFANVVEVKLVETDEVMKMHPVVILLMVALFGYIWGPTGMLLSVPLVAYLKAVLLSDSVPPCYRDPILIFLEGDRLAPLRHSERLRMERQKSQEQDEELESLIPSREPSRGSRGSMSMGEQPPSERGRSPARVGP